MKIYYIAVSSWDGRAYTFDYNEFFFSEQERDAAYEKLLHNANFDVCKGEESMPEIFDSVAFQKGMQEGRRLEREEMPKWRNYGPNIIKDPFITDLGSLVVGEKCIRIYELYNLPGFKND